MQFPRISDISAAWNNRFKKRQIVVSIEPKAYIWDQFCIGYSANRSGLVYFALKQTKQSDPLLVCFIELASATMKLLVDCFLVLLACNQANPYFVAGETFGFSSMEEPSWSSSFSENDIPEVERHDEPVVQTISTPKFTSSYITTVATTTPSPAPVLTKPVPTTKRPKRPTNRRNRPVSRGTVEEDRTPGGEESPDGGDRSQVLSTVLAFKNIVRSIQSEMNEVRTSCDECSENRNNHNNVDTCASSKEADSKIKQQLRDLKSSVKNIDASLVQLQNSINTIGG